MLEAVERAGIPVVLIDRDTEGGDFDAVFIDNKGAIYKATEQLIQAGHTKIAAVTSPCLLYTSTYMEVKRLHSC